LECSRETNGQEANKFSDVNELFIGSEINIRLASQKLTLVAIYKSTKRLSRSVPDEQRKQVLKRLKVVMTKE
jgi:hypothetical protein